MLKKFNSNHSIKIVLFCLITVLISVSIYFFAPDLKFYAQKHFEKDKINLAISNENRIVIPEILVDSTILEGNEEEILEKGLWRRPNTSTPDQKGNTVIAGHRFMYRSGANTFYHLDKINIGDEIFIDWQGSRYTYMVKGKELVDATNLSIESQLEENTLTLFTCTSFTNSEERLVITASGI